MAEKRSPRKSLRSTIAEARPRASPVGTLSGRNPEVVAAGEKMSKHHHALNTGGTQRVIIATLRAWIGFRLNLYGKCWMISFILGYACEVPNLR